MDLEGIELGIELKALRNEIKKKEAEIARLVKVIKENDLEDEIEGLTELTDEEIINLISEYGMDALNKDARDKWIKDNNIPTRRLHLKWHQRSCDLGLGIPFNIASYALFTIMIAQVTDLEVGDFIHTFGDVHLYNNHIEQAKEQLSREFRPLPKMKVNSKIKNINEFEYEDFELINYDPHPHIKASVSI